MILLGMDVEVGAIWLKGTPVWTMAWKSNGISLSPKRLPKLLKDRTLPGGLWVSQKMVENVYWADINEDI